MLFLYSKATHVLQTLLQNERIFAVLIGVSFSVAFLVYTRSHIVTEEETMPRRLSQGDDGICRLRSFSMKFWELKNVGILMILELQILGMSK